MSSESQGMVVWNRNAVVRGLGGFQDDVAADLVHLAYCHFRHRGQRGAHRKRREEASCDKEDFIANQVKPTRWGRR